MFIRNGVWSTLRAKGRSALFFLLILLLTLSLSLGLGMWATCARNLAVMDENYLSVALVEYMGESYPDQDTADEGARQAAAALDPEAVADIPGVTLWEPADQTFAALDGYTRTLGNRPYSSYGVVVATGLTPLYQYGVEWQEEDFQLPDAACAVTNYITGEVTYYAPGRDPIVIPCYLYDEQENQYYLCTLRDGEYFQQPVEADSLPDRYYLGSTLQGSVPDAYQPASGHFYYYDPQTGLYGVDGEVPYAYTGRITDVLYAGATQGGVMAIFDPGELDFEPDSTDTYLLHGTFVDGGTSNLTFELTEFYQGCETPPYLELSGSKDPALTDSLFADYADRYQQANNYVRLQASGDIPALEVFQQGVLYLEQGRFPEAGEAGVCLVDGRTAMQLGLEPGSTVEVTVLTSQEEDRFITQAADTRTLEVVGITNPADDYEGSLWVSDAEGGFGGSLFGCQLGRAVLDNARGQQAADAIRAMAPDGVRVTLYDQGYSVAAQPLETMQATAMAVTAACACSVLVVLFLFAYLFVGRQRETVALLVSLGTPAGKIRLWMLSGAALVSGAAALVGAVAGGLSLNGILQLAMTSARQLYAVDPRYSDAAIGVSKPAPELSGAPWWPAVVSGAAVFVLALVLCLVFLRQAGRQSAPRQGKTSVRVPRGTTSTIGRGALRYALLAIRRGGGRTAVVPATALVLAVLLGLLAAGTRGWNDRIDTLYDTAEITGQTTSTNGRQATNLALYASNTRVLWDSGMLSDLSVSKSWHYWLWDKMPDFGSGGFAEESRSNWIARQPEVVALNSLDAAPAFFYDTGEPEIEWLDGWDESFLAKSDWEPILDSFPLGSRTPVGGDSWEFYPGLVSREFLEENGLALGDVLDVGLRLDLVAFGELDASFPLEIVGVYSGTADQQQIYIPLAFWFDPQWLTGTTPVADGQMAGSDFIDEDGRDAYFYTYTTFSTCRFTLASPRQLDAFRDYLQGQGISQVNQLAENRTTVVLQDSSFVETVSGLGRYVTFSRILLPVLCVMVVLLGFIISWLMINGRRMEFAIMRGLGAGRGRVFGSFFLEQAILALAGCLAGCLVLALTGAGLTGCLAAGVLLVCYLAGCAVAVLTVGRTNLMQLLSEKE